ncbi:MAG: RNA ligase family protein [Roseiflexaceae bacterium]
MQPIRKYPRTTHLEGSGLQADDDPNTAAWSTLAGQHLLIEEKMDGANCGISFAADGTLRLQSRGHVLSGGPRERQFDLFKRWASHHVDRLFDLLTDRYVLYGEWLYGKHSIFYTDLPHYLMEFDMFDQQTGQFLSTPRRHALLSHAPWVVSVAVLYEGSLSDLAALTKLVGPSQFIAPTQRADLLAAAAAQGYDPLLAERESDLSGLMEGLYIKVEDEQQVLGRYKYVRPGFLQTVLDSGSHWMDRPLIPNRLRAEVDLWAH